MPKEYEYHEGKTDSANGIRGIQGRGEGGSNFTKYGEF
jgi:hypothetical protein